MQLLLQLGTVAICGFLMRSPDWYPVTGPGWVTGAQEWYRSIDWCSLMPGRTLCRMALPSGRLRPCSHQFPLRCTQWHAAIMGKPILSATIQHREGKGREEPDIDPVSQLGSYLGLKNQQKRDGWTVRNVAKPKIQNNRCPYRPGIRGKLGKLTPRTVKYIKCK